MWVFKCPVYRTPFVGLLGQQKMERSRKEMRKIDFNRKESERCGICHNMAHRGYLTVQTVQEHSCIEKNCVFLERLEHPFWVRRDKQKRKRGKIKLEKKVFKALSEMNPYWSPGRCRQMAKEMDIVALKAFVRGQSEGRT